MSEKRTSQSADLEQTQQPTNAAPQAARRRLLKGSVAIPVIMTLHSGAALARSSNLASPSETPHKIDEELVCALTNPDDPSGPPYDLTDAPVYKLVGEPGECIPPNGVLLSTSAFNSLTGRGMTAI